MRRHFFSFFVLAVFSWLFFPLRTAAADPKPVIKDSQYAAAFVSQSIADPVAIQAGETKTVTVRFKNVGSATWAALGSRFVSAYTVEPRDRPSAFAGADWISAKQTNAIQQITKPGEIAELSVAFTAPATPGTYTEQFYLAAENHTWIRGGYFFITFTVAERAAPVVQAHKFIQSPQAVEAKGGERVSLILAFQNLGSTAWHTVALRAKSPVHIAQSGSLSFADETWIGPDLVVQKSQTVRPQEFLRETVYFRAPRHIGTYTAGFQLEIDGVLVPDVEVEVPVTVTEYAPEHDITVLEPSPSLVSYRLPAEPRIRVGLWQSPEFVQFRSEEDDYAVFAGETQVGILPRQRFGILKMENGQYSFKGGDVEILSNEYLRLAPLNHSHATFILWNYNRRVSWKGAGNFNEYRGALEYRRGERKGDLWAVNDLLLEDYIRGVAENSNGAPAEYLKSQTVAQRSYAYATIQSDKYGIFDVVATTGDQLYLGVLSEKLTPNFVAAAEATRGRMVLYEDKVVLTPYFANADCRTRGWHEVWGGALKPWLVSVQTTYDCAAGRGKKGHGVGMSQLDASARAKNEGLDFTALLHYYYTGVTIEKLYE